jgi:hypothetical protein
VIRVSVTVAVPEPCSGVAERKRMPSAAATVTDAPLIGVMPKFFTRTRNG